eukprot:6312100-Pyramimonas_sp.AAC.1
MRGRRGDRSGEEVSNSEGGGWTLGVRRVDVRGEEGDVKGKEVDVRGEHLAAPGLDVVRLWFAHPVRLITVEERHLGRANEGT